MNNISDILNCLHQAKVELGATHKAEAVIDNCMWPQIANELFVEYQKNINLQTSILLLIGRVSTEKYLSSLYCENIIFSGLQSKNISVRHAAITAADNLYPITKSLLENHIDKNSFLKSYTESILNHNA